MAKSEIILDAKRSGIKVFANPETKVTAAVVANGDIKGFALISSAYCSKNDKFSKRIGKETAANRLLNGNYILVPCNGRTLEEIVIDATNGVIF